MLETKFNPKHTVLRNLLRIKGVGVSKAREICESVGVSAHTLQEELSPVRADRLSQTLVNIKKLTKPSPLQDASRASVAEREAAPAADTRPARSREALAE